MFDVEAQPVINAHVLVCHPDQSEERNDITPPVEEEHLEPREHKHQRRHVVAETVLAGEKVEKLAPQKTLRASALTLTIFSRFSKDFLVSDSPRDAGNGYSQYQEPDELRS